MGRVISTAIQFIDGFTKPSKAVIDNMRKMGNEAIKAGKQIQNAGKTITGAGNMLTNAITKPALGAASALAGIALVKGFDRLKNIDEAKGSLKGLGHSAESIDAIMKDALTSVRGTAFGLGEAAQTAAGAVASGVEPGEKLARVLSLTADAATIGKMSMAEMGAIFGKVQASNKMSANEANQMIAAGIPIYQMLAKSSGKSVEQIRKDMSKGAISAETFYNAIEQGMGGAAKYLGNDTVSGAIKNTGAALGRLGAAFLSAGDGGGLFGKIAPALTAIQSKMDLLAPIVEKWGEKAGEAVNNIVEKAKSLKNWFDSLSPSAKSLVVKLAGIAVAAGPVIMTFGKVVTTVGTAVKTFGVISKTIANFGGVVGLITSPAGIVIMVLAAIALAAFLIIKNWDKVKVMLSNVGNWFRNAFEGAGFSVEQFRTRFQSIGNTLREIGTKIWGICKIITKAFTNAFGGDVKDSANSFIEMLESIVVAVIGAFDQITIAVDIGLKVFSAFIDFFTGGFAGDWENAANGFRESLITIFPPDLADNLIQVFDFMLPGIIAVIEAIKMTIKGLVEDIKPIIGNFKMVFEGISTIFKGLFNGDLETVFVGVKQAIGGVIDAIGNIVKARLNVVKNFALSILSNFLPKEAIEKIAMAFDGVATAWDVAIAAAKGYVDGFLTAIRPLFDDIQAVLSGIGMFLEGVFTGDWKSALEGLKMIAKGVFSSLVNIFKAPFVLIGGIIKRVVKEFDLMKIIKSIISGVGNFIAKILTKCGVDMEGLTATIGRVRNRIRNIINNLKAIFTPVFRVIGNLVRRVGNVFKNVFASRVKNACTTSSHVIGTLRTVVVMVFEAISNKISIVASFISSCIRTTFSTIRIVIGMAVTNISILIETVVTVFEGVTTFLKGVFTGDWEMAWTGIQTIFSGLFGGIKEIAQNTMNGLIDIINLGISKINGLSFTTPAWLPGGIGGKTFAPNIPAIPKLFAGTQNWQGGTAMIHDQGAEIVDLPSGSRVYPHDKSISMARQEGAAAAGGRGIQITIQKLADKIEVRSDEDIDRIAEALALKLKKVALNTGMA